LDYIYHLLVVLSIYVILASSLDVLLGHTGVVSVGHAGFYGVGAYAAAIAATELHVPFLVTLLLSVVVSVVVCALLAFPSVRLGEDSLVLGTLCFQVLLSSLFLNWRSVTHGAQGITGVPPAVLFGITFDTPKRFFVLSGTLCLIVLFLVHRLVSSPLGRLLHAIREDEDVLAVAGKNPTVIKGVAFCFAGGLAAIAGVLYSYYSTYVSPSSFGLMESVLIASMVIIGGPGRIVGPVLGAGLLVAFPELLRFLGLPTAVAASTRQILYGVLLVITAVARPSGFSRLPKGGPL
jgi:branched-chain amino acid transport system permease protein